LCFSFCTASATPALYTLSLHDALPICARHSGRRRGRTGSNAGTGPGRPLPVGRVGGAGPAAAGEAPARQFRFPQRAEAENSGSRSEEHTSELQSRENLVCRLLLEKKKK